jgi:hypothetical protein
MSDDVIESNLKAYLEYAIASEEGKFLTIDYTFRDLQLLSLAAEPEIRKQLAQLGENATKLARLVKDLLDHTETED